jgi:hypothetical protein
MEVMRDIPARPDLPLPQILRIAHGAIFAPNGELPSKPGYHPQAKAYIDRAVEVQPFQGTAPEAAQWIYRELFSDFPFTNEADRANALGALLSCLAISGAEVART